MIGDCWNITDIEKESDGSITFKQDGASFKATVYRKMRMKSGKILYDIIEI